MRVKNVAQGVKIMFRSTVFNVGDNERCAESRLPDRSLAFALSYTIVASLL
jgi:hypothetical protein